jgi:uncharacterized membrane protein (DUF106 family)
MAKKESAVIKKEQMKQLLEVILMALGFFILFGIMIIPGLRGGIAVALEFVLGPIAASVNNFLITILILSVVTGIYTSIVQKYTMNWELMEKSREYQKQLRELQKEYFEAKKENNKHRMKKIEKKRAEIMRKQTQFSGEMFRQQMKPMAYIGIITIPIFMWIWEIGVNLYAGGGTVIFPLVGEKALSDVFIYHLPYWVLWYMICSIPLTQLIRKLMGMRSGM